VNKPPTSMIEDYFFAPTTTRLATPHNALIYTDDDGNDTDILQAIKRLDTNYKTIMERLSILDNPSAEQLEKHKMLKEAYTKYKFIESLCIEEDDS